MLLHSAHRFHTASAPICLIGYGTRAAERLALCGLPGSLVGDWCATELRGGTDAR